MRSDKWRLKCRIQKGMFDDEYLVIIEVMDERGENIEAATFVYKDEIKVDLFPKKSEVVEGLLAVSLIGITHEKASVVLPNSTLANGNIVLVKTSDLVRMGG